MENTENPKLNKKRIKLKESGSNTDTIIIVLTALLCLFGLVMVYSASYYISINEGLSASNYLIRQACFEAVGVLLMALFIKTDYHRWLKLWPFFYIAGLVLLVAVIAFGQVANGGQRWLKVGSLTLMPGEVAKACIIMAVTGFLSVNPKRANMFKKGLIPVLSGTGVYVVLIMVQPNMSTAFTIAFIVAGMLFVAGTDIKTFGAITVFVLAVGAIFVFTDEYRIHRVQYMFNPFLDELGSGYQVVQSLLALGSGGLTGKGLGNSVQKNLYLPEAHNDFILSVIGEEFGYIGILILMSVYLILIWRGLRIAINAQDYEGMMLASGIVIMIAFQVLINVGVVTACAPPTGVILPFISYGGNGLWLFMCMTGMLLNVGKTANI